MILTAIALQATELAAWAGLWMHTQRTLVKDILVHGKKQPTKLPLIDHQLQKLVGHPTGVNRTIAKRITSMARVAVNTKAFEHVVSGLCNSKSKMRKHIVRKLPVVRILS